MASLPGGTVTFLFTDIEGSTRLLQELGDAYAEVVAGHRRLLREAFGAAGGSEVDTQGDAFFYSFPRARDAVAGAVAGQRSLAGHAWPGGADVRVRMGLHTGEPAVGEEGYVGLDVVRAARICAAAHGGQILLSETTRALLGGDLPAGTSVRDLGEQQLKDVRAERLYQLELADAPRSFPPPRTHEAASTGTLADRFDRQIEDYVERQLAAALAGGSEMRSLVGITAFGLATAAVAIAILIVVALVVRSVFF
ncbi:MAG TPA: adenylate/guanylate cyclase domain-containing protein [Gaiellaceae bacterium]|jgi:class 3 adenylate cyclase|nr:adenylate/guanylate cyclase domain-containing protein [Gaiellaceae bacterium]